MLTFAPSLADIFQSNLSGLVIAIVGSQLMDWGLDSTEETFIFTKDYFFFQTKLGFKFVIKSMMLIIIQIFWLEYLKNA